MSTTLSASMFNIISPRVQAPASGREQRITMSLQAEEERPSEKPGKLFVCYWGFTPILGQRSVEIHNASWFTSDRGYSLAAVSKIISLSVDEIADLTRRTGFLSVHSHKVWRVE